MRKLYIAICTALMLGTVACVNNRDANLTEPYVYIVKDGFQVAEFYDLDHEPTAVVNIHRSGYFAEDAVVNVAVDPTAIDEYNEANGTSYQALTEGTFWLVNETVNITSDIRTAAVKVGFDYETIAALEANHNLVVPIRISSSSNLNKDKSIVLISPTMLPAEIFFMPNRQEVVKWSSSSAYFYERKLTVSVPFNNPMDCDITLDTSLNAFNRFGDGSYLNACPRDAYEIVGEPVLLAGQSKLELTLRVDLSKLPTNTYRCSIPVVMTANSENYVINAANQYMLIHLQQDGVVPTIVDEGDRRNKWSLWECNSAHGNVTATQNNYNHMIDGDVSTYWHSGYNTSSFIAENISCSKENPYIVAWDLQTEHNLVGVSITRRSYQDYIVGYVQVSADGYTWQNVASFDHITQCGGDLTLVGPFTYEFTGDANVQYVRVCVTNCARGTTAAQYANIAEFNVLEVKLAE